MSGYYAYMAYCRHIPTKEGLKAWKKMSLEERDIWEKIAAEIAVQAFSNVSDSLMALKADINDVIKAINKVKD